MGRISYLVLAVFMALAWWRDPRPRIRAVTSEAIMLRRNGLVQAITAADLVDVVPKCTGNYGLELTVRGDGPLRLDGTAPQFSLAAAQAAALRRWAGLES